MMVVRKDGTIDVGPLDVVCILHDVNTGRYHSAFFEEYPLPGPVKPFNEVEIVRLKSKMHHETGSENLEGAFVHLHDLADKLNVYADNVWKDPIGWDGHPGVVITLPNWRKSES